MTDNEPQRPETMTDTTRGTTSDRPSTGDGAAYRPTLGEVSHTNPYTGTVFGDTQTYSRGRTVAADGGKADALPGDHEPSAEDETLADVDHTPTGEVDGAQAAYDRGEETTSEPGDE